MFEEGAAVVWVELWSHIAWIDVYMSVTSCTDSHSLTVTAVPSWVQQPCPEGAFLSCTLCPARLGCVNEVDREWSVRNANTVSYQYIPECPTDCAACSFLSSTPECNLCLVIQWKSYAFEETKRDVQAGSCSCLSCVNRKRVIRFTSTSSVRWRRVHQEPSDLIRAITLPFYDCVLFYPSTECMSMNVQ